MSNTLSYSCIYFVKEGGHLKCTAKLSQKCWSGGKIGLGDQNFRNIGPGGPFFLKILAPLWKYWSNLVVRLIELLHCHFQPQLHWHAVPPTSPPHRLHPRILRVKLKELLKSCIGTKEEERTIVQQSSRKEHQSQRVDAEEETETVKGSEETESDWCR